MMDIPANAKYGIIRETSLRTDNLLNREFETHGSRAVLLTDITYISNGKAPR